MYDVSEVPWFIKAGSILPLKGLKKILGGALEPFSVLEFLVAPGGEEGGCEVFEDDGLSDGYLRGEGWKLKVGYRLNESKTGLSVSFRGEGSWPSMPNRRIYEVFLPLSSPPESVEFDGRPLPFLPRFSHRKHEGWWYDSKNLEVGVRIRSISAVSASLELSWKAPSSFLASSKYGGLPAALRRAHLAHATLSEARLVPGEMPFMSEHDIEPYSHHNDKLMRIGNFAAKIDAWVARKQREKMEEEGEDPDLFPDSPFKRYNSIPERILSEHQQLGSFEDLLKEFIDLWPSALAEVSVEGLLGPHWASRPLPLQKRVEYCRKILGVMDSAQNLCHEKAELHPGITERCEAGRKERMEGENVGTPSSALVLKESFPLDVPSPRVSAYTKGEGKRTGKGKGRKGRKEKAPVEPEKSQIEEVNVM